MGSPLSPIVANIYMEAFEQEAIHLAADKPRLWVRYVDDTFVIWPHGHDKLELFRQHLNNIRDPIKFTMETEDNGQLPFLDVLVNRTGNRMTTAVYRKKTHTDRYLHYNSHHHPRIKSGIISCLRQRACNVCSSEDLQPELRHLEKTFQSNGYPTWVVQKVLSKRRQPSTPEPSEDNEKPKTLFLPYVKGLSEKIDRQVRRLNIRTVFTTRTTVRRRLMRVKGKPPQEDVRGVIYSIPCECGAIYIGETGRTLKTRLAEHQRAVNTMNSNNGIAVHVMMTHHTIKWEGARVVSVEPHLTKRKVKEALTIRRTPNNMNLDSGFQLDSVWCHSSLPSSTPHPRPPLTTHS